jgi:hypothetical protein
MKYLVLTLIALGFSTAARAEFYFECRLSRGDAWAQALAPREIRFDEAGEWSLSVVEGRGPVKQLVTVEAREKNWPTGIATDADVITFKVARTKQAQGRWFDGRETYEFQWCANEETSTASYEFRAPSAAGQPWRVVARAAYTCECGVD